MSDQNRVPHQRNRPRIRCRAAVFVVAGCLAFVACSYGDDASGPATEVQLRRRLSDTDLATEVIDCVLQLAGDELRRGALDPIMEEELVVNCEQAQDVLDQSDTELDGSGGGEWSGRGLAFSDIPDDQPVDYGDDPALDRLWDGCEAGDGGSCDQLFEQSPVGSRYEQFGLTCGDRDRVLHCRELDTQPDSP